MSLQRIKFFLLFFLLALPLLFGGLVFAETSAERKVRLERELAVIEAEIAEQEKVLAQQKAQTGSIARDLDILRSEIRQKQLEIDKKRRLINNIGAEIIEKNETIKDLGQELTREQASLAAILRRMDERESYTFIEFMASDKSVSEMFDDLIIYTKLQKSLQESFTTIKNLQELTTAEKEALEQKKIAEVDTQYALEQDKAKVKEKEGEKNNLYNVSKTKEKTYEQVIAEKRAKAAQVRTALFELRGQASVQFGDMYEYAKMASAKTGVDTAFILAVLKQESNLGKNVGTCNRPQDTLKWDDIMPGPNDNSWRDDQTTYLAIMSRLGKNPEGQPLSCPLFRDGKRQGWGGAMGPSQFIPATWVQYESRVASAVGVPLADPWNPRHAVMATAIYMQDLGASAGTYTAEREAACKYYSGKGCSAPNVRNAFYGDGVLAHKKTIQGMIDVLESV